MDKLNSNNDINNQSSNEKILLVFLPFWTPYLPPQGMTTLKSFLGKHGYHVKTVDVNMMGQFRLFYSKYFDTLKEYIPQGKRGNFYNIGHDVLFNHMMGHLDYRDEGKYIEYVKEVIYKTYYTLLDNREVLQLNGILAEFYACLQDYLLDLVEKEEPVIFGSTAYYGTLPASLFAFRLVKEKYPHIKTAVGGGSFADHLLVGSPNFNRFIESTKEYLDQVFIGQGQFLFLKWLRGELDHSRRVHTLQDIGNKTTDIASDGDIPDLTDLNPIEYNFLAATGSRSCSYQCGFCNVQKFWGKHRVKNVAQTVDEMILQYEKYGMQLFFMYDALLNSYITDFAKEFLKRDKTLYYVGYLRACPEACDINHTMLWRRGGFYRARMGVESGSQRVLDLIGKEITVEQIRGTITSLAYAGIKTTTYWLIGYPGETEEEFRMTMDIVEELKDDIWESECNPFNYFYSGQNSENEWAAKRMLLYPGDMSKMMMTPTWTLDIEPKREEVYQRMNRFVQHCDKLGIPNPYSIHEIYKADERWKKLHKNAVPSFADLKDVKVYIDESNKLKEFIFAQTAKQDKGDFAF
jgi:radical SAM superfamily enzyme YgiQ (UPF0313 family)